MHRFKSTTCFIRRDPNAFLYPRQDECRREFWTVGSIPRLGDINDPIDDLDMANM